MRSIGGSVAHPIFIADGDRTGRAGELRRELRSTVETSYVMPGMETVMSVIGQVALLVLIGLPLFGAARACVDAPPRAKANSPLPRKKYDAYGFLDTCP